MFKRLPHQSQSRCQSRRRMRIWLWVYGKFKSAHEYEYITLSAWRAAWLLRKTSRYMLFRSNCEGLRCDRRGGATFRWGADFERVGHVAFWLARLSLNHFTDIQDPFGKLHGHIRNTDIFSLHALTMERFWSGRSSKGRDLLLEGGIRSRSILYTQLQVRPHLAVG